jgi:hypothetical protein
METSEVLVLNTGAPQGCVMSPVLFTIYTNDLTWPSDGVHIIKYADDTAIIGLVEEDNDIEYMECIKFVGKWCKDNFLDLNVQKTKEVIFDFRKNSAHKQPVRIDSECIEVVNEYKYLGVLIDNKLSFKFHVEQQVKKVQKGLYFVRYLRKFNIDKELIVLFVQATITSVLLYACPAFFGMLSVNLKDALAKPMRLCQRMLRGCDLMTNTRT